MVEVRALTLFLLLSLLLAVVPAYPCAQLVSERAFFDLDTGTFRRDTGRGYAVLNAQSLFEGLPVREWYDAIPKNEVVVVHPGRFHAVPGSFLNSRGSMKLAHLQALQERVATLSEWVRQSLPPDEEIRLGYAELRVDGAHQVTRWHYDEGYVAVAVSLMGPGTEYVEDEWARQLLTGPGEQKWTAREQLEAGIPWAQTPTGHALVFSATGRNCRHPTVLPTLHRSPSFLGERLFLILRYEAPGQVSW